MPRTRKKSSSDLDQNIVQALAHPLRVQLLTRLNEKVASPNELAQELGEPLGNVSYHVRVLADLGCIELVDTAQRRGAIEHYYRAMVRPFFSDEDWARVPVSARSGISNVFLRRIFDDASADGTLGSRDDEHLSRVHLVLDQEGWAEINGLLADLLDRALEISAESAGRLVGSTNADGSLKTVLSLMHFELARAAAERVEVPAAPAKKGRRARPKSASGGRRRG
jgi:DNA-binding transcriptional ArsR family regulator